MQIFIDILRDGFTHRTSRTWPTDPRFWGPRAILPYDDSILTEICETAQRHNFKIYLERSGNSNFYSRPL